MLRGRTLDAHPQLLLERDAFRAVLLDHVCIGDGALEVRLEAQMAGEVVGRQAERAQRRSEPLEIALTTASMSGRGSLTTTFSPWARNSAAHDEPITPAPMTATFG